MEIPTGASTAKIADILQDAGVISNAWLFRAYAKLAGVDGALKAGHYRLETGMGLKELTRRLIEGSPESVLVTVVEGQTLEEIARTLDKAGVVNAAEFLRLAYDPVYTLGAEMPHWLYGAKNLEGFLFPDTYRFSPKQPAKEVILTMFRQFLKKTADLQEASWVVEELGVVNWVTLASVVQKEGRLTEEFPLIASVFLNRLDKNMLLQSCATVQFVLGTPKPVLTEKDLQIESEYNTYQNPGLPPGPIGAPGLAALKAAAIPAESSYLYFVAKGDGSHAFSKTYRDHLAAKRKYERE